MLQGSWTYHHKVVEDGGDQVGGDEGEVRGQELCEPCDGDARGDLGEGEGMSRTRAHTRTHTHHHLEGSKEPLAGVKLGEFGEDVLQGVAELADCHGEGGVQDAGQMLLNVQTRPMLQVGLLVLGSQVKGQEVNETLSLFLHCLPRLAAGLAGRHTPASPDQHRHMSHDIG